MKRIDTILSQYLEAAIGHGRATENGDYKTANKCYFRIIRALRELDAKQHRESLLRLLDHDDPHAREWAATHLLNIHPERAVRALAEIAKLPGLAHGNAELVLDLWRKGTLDVP